MMFDSYISKKIYKDRFTTKIVLIFMMVYFIKIFVTNKQDIVIYNPQTVVTNYLSEYPKHIVSSKRIIYRYVNMSQNKKMIYMSNSVYNILKDNKIMMLNSIEEANSTFYHLRNVYVNRMGGIINNHTQFLVPYPNNVVWAYKGNLVGIYENVTFIGNFYGEMFGHWLKDTLAPFLLLPREIQQNSDLLLPGVPEIARDTLHILGFNETRAIFIKKKDDMIYTNNLYTIAGITPHIAHFSVAILNLQEKFFKALNLSKQEPILYVLLNRPKGFCRYIKNFDVFCLKEKQEFRDYDWTIWPHQFDTITERGCLTCGKN